MVFKACLAYENKTQRAKTSIGGANSASLPVRVHEGANVASGTCHTIIALNASLGFHRMRLRRRFRRLVIRRRWSEMPPVLLMSVVCAWVNGHFVLDTGNDVCLTTSFYSCLRLSCQVKLCLARSAGRKAKPAVFHVDDLGCPFVLAWVPRDSLSSERTSYT